MGWWLLNMGPHLIWDVNASFFFFSLVPSFASSSISTFVSFHSYIFFIHALICIALILKFKNIYITKLTSIWMIKLCNTSSTMSWRMVSYFILKKLWTRRKFCMWYVSFFPLIIWCLHFCVCFFSMICNARGVFFQDLDCG
jgi:hypothetical protein